MIRRWWRCHQRWLMQIVVIDQTCNFVNAAPATNRQYHARCLIVLMSRIPTVCLLEANVLVDLPRKWSCQIWKQYSNMSARCQITLQRSAHSQEVASMSAAERRRYLFENWRKADTFLRIQLKLNTALLSTVRPSVCPSVTGVTSHISHIYKGINAMLIIRGPIEPYIFWIKIILAIFLAKTRPDKAIVSDLTNLTIDFDFELSKI